MKKEEKNATPPDSDVGGSTQKDQEQSLCDRETDSSVGKATEKKDTKMKPIWRWFPWDTKVPQAQLRRASLA